MSKKKGLNFNLIKDRFTCLGAGKTFGFKELEYRKKKRYRKKNYELNYIKTIEVVFFLYILTKPFTKTFSIHDFFIFSLSRWMGPDDWKISKNISSLQTHSSK